MNSTCKGPPPGDYSTALAELILIGLAMLVLTWMTQCGVYLRKKKPTNIQQEADTTR